MLSHLKIYNFLFILCVCNVELIFGSGSTDSATIRAIESEVRRLKGTSDNIFGELKKQKEGTTALQNEFKWLHNELKGMKKSLSDIEVLVNQTVRNDTEFIREKITALNNFIFKIGKVNTNQTAVNVTTTNGTTTTPASTTAAAIKKFKLF